LNGFYSDTNHVFGSEIMMLNSSKLSAVMKKHLLLVWIFIMVLSCSSDNKSKIVHNETSQNHSQGVQKDSASVEIADLPIQIDSTDYLIHPVGNFKIEDNHRKSVYKSSGYGTRGFSVSNYANYKLTGDLSNVHFQHIDSEKLTKLTTKRLKISSIHFLRTIYETTKKQVLIYEVTDKDTNQDGYLNSEDVKALYVSEISGKGFKKLSETNTDLIDWRVVEAMNRLYFRTIEDINKDGVFDAKDVVHYNYVDFNAEAVKVIEYSPL